MSDDSESGTSAFLSFLLGGLTGAALALLYAPRTGRETREMLNEKVREGAERGREVKEQVRIKGRAVLDDAADYVDRQREAVEQRKERLAAAVEAGRQAFREEKDRGNA